MLAAVAVREYPFPGQMRVRLPFPKVARIFGWVLEVVATLFAILTVFSPPADAPVVLVVLASLAVALMGELTRSGYSEIVVTAGSRRVSGGLCTRLGRVPMLYVEGQVPPGKRLAVLRTPSNQHAMYGLYLPGTRARSRPGLMHFHTREEAEEVSGWVSDVLDRGTS